MQEQRSFHYVFQITKLIVFEVDYSRCRDNHNKHFSTSASQFVKNKQDYDCCGQAQRELLSNPKGVPAYRFFKKWDKKHLRDLSTIEYANVIGDIEELKSCYNYLERFDIGTHFSFGTIKEFSKQTLKVIK